MTDLERRFLERYVEFKKKANKWIVDKIVDPISYQLELAYYSIVWKNEMKEVRHVLESFNRIISRSEMASVVPSSLRIVLLFKETDRFKNALGSFNARSAEHNNDSVIYIPLFNYLKFYRDPRGGRNTFKVQLFKTLFHEYGHAIDYYRNPKLYNLRVRMLISATYRGEFPLYRRLCVEAERKADFFGFRLIPTSFSIMRKYYLLLSGNSIGHSIDFDFKEFKKRHLAHLKWKEEIRLHYLKKQSLSSQTVEQASNN